ncbi:MAG TPA: efflux transporter outer membrane subunit [Tepidisphaeraceae bacterium]|jgi:NodT family efflux transporter outer membrane factor (OMF) lipoprotein
MPISSLKAHGFAVGRTSTITLTLAFLLGSLVISGCTVGPDFHPPHPSMPQSWLGPTTAPTTQQSVATTQPADVTNWWTVFDDPTLESLIDRALAANLDLQQAESRIRQARALRTIAKADQVPNVNSSGSYQRTGVNDHSADLWRAGLDANWELDIFGGIRRNVESADAEITFAVEDYRDVMVSLVAEVALDYIDLRGFQREIDIAHSNLDAQRHSADLTRQRFPAFVGGLDVANAEAAVWTTEAAIPSLEQSSRQTIYALAVLLNEDQATLVEELSPPGAIPPKPPQVPIGLPSELLRRRPDIRRAEASLHSATAQIGVATADLFPRFALTGSLATTGANFSSLSNWSAAVWSIGPTMSWPIFQGGRIRANIDVKNELTQQALLEYKRTVLIAMQDVESALIAYEKEQQRYDSLVAAVEANRRAVRISTDLYTQGNTDFLNVLSAQRSLLLTEDALVQSQRTIATNLVALYKAIGGGWDPAQGDPTTQPSSNSTLR